ncbi:uncharacterized protein KY384_000923 [Bacidia gigantensis]|uniref:uncharacterized protein n=1 Tax=Bacidia gigantensis TaxID=2732470 RepID=UPI001D045819|nr:uncharacterized protein KY384_000923 [Bacidia gigantensis]KAG8534080.1 hypothetical protein KY384_000923 [Bacidia gigantensis]
MVVTTALRNIKDTGYPLRHQMWDLMTIKTWQLGLSDAAMIISTALAVPFQQLMQKTTGWMRWTRAVFFTLHTLVILMKMHSYAFYNGHLSNTQQRLRALDKPVKHSRAAAVRYPSFTTDFKELEALAEQEQSNKEVADLSQLRNDLATELISPLGAVTYPTNLTIANYTDYLLCPTLCYELEYPRTLKVNWAELFWKTLAVFGCIFLLMLTSEEFIVPVLHNSAIRLQAIDSWFEFGLILAESISELLFPFMVTFLLVFLVIFDDRFSLASSQLQSFYTSLPPALRTQVASALNIIQRALPHQAHQQPPTFSQKALELYSKSTTSQLVAITATLVVALFTLMSSYWPGAGRYSPFTSTYDHPFPPRVTSDDYSYIAGDDDKARHNSYGFPSNATSQHHDKHYRGGSSGSAMMEEPKGLAPDVIILKFRGTPIPLHFKAYSISEGDLRVKDLRRAAAKELKVDDPRKLKLLYKGKQLKDDRETCKYENLKQNSEVMCVLSHDGARSSGTSDSDGSDSVATSGAVIEDDDRRERKKRKNHRGGKRKPRRADEDERERDRKDTLAPPAPAEHRPSTSRNASPAPLREPTDAAGKIDFIEANFDRVLLPQINNFILHPPEEKKDRDYEYKKLSETTLTQTLLKFDEVETMGDERLRARRKESVKRIQDILKTLDAAGQR